ncbi:MAG: glutamate racemase [Deltaproteobacteria bacterium]|nr:glutamate racemase [Deltaproteobacteria bacterium]
MIGIFDSGVGGMTVAHAIEQACPGQKFIYFGDLARAPYGSKSPETIRRYARNNIEFLLARGAKLIIIACNSAASVAAAEMRQEFDLPIFDVIGPAVARVGRIAAGLGGYWRTGVIGTRATIKSNIYAREIQALNPAVTVYSQACPLLVSLVEEGWLNHRETKMILRRYLRPLRIKQVNALVLGCTHYPLLKPLIQARIGKRVKIIDSSVEVASVLQRYLARQPAGTYGESGRDSEFYVSDITTAARATARRIFGRPIDLIKV